MKFSTYIKTLAVATFVAQGVLIGIGITQLKPEVDGLPPFDVRLMGYGPSEAQVFLDALTERGEAVIHGPLAIVDTVFPALMGLFLASLLWRFGPRWLIAFPVLFTAFDFQENAVIAKMVRTGDATLANTASNLTQFKFSLVIVSVILILITYWRSRKRKGRVRTQ